MATDYPSSGTSITHLVEMGRKIVFVREQWSNLKNFVKLLKEDQLFQSGLFCNDKRDAIVPNRVFKWGTTISHPKRCRVFLCDIQHPCYYNNSSYNDDFTLPLVWVPFPIHKYHPKIYEDPYDGCWLLVGSWRQLEKPRQCHYQIIQFGPLPMSIGRR